MEWFSISTIIVIAGVCFASVIASVLMISYMIYKEETCPENQKSRVEEEPTRRKLFSAF